MFAQPGLLAMLQYFSLTTKSANGTFQPGFSAKQTGVDDAVQYPWSRGV
jgi:hypothetical protein